MAEVERSDLYKKGDALRRKMYGDEAYERANNGVYGDPIMRKFLDVATETVFGALWTRPGLDVKTRALICVVSDISTQREDELEIHLRFAIGQGWTEDELLETMLHLSGYIGVPCVRGAMLVAKRVFAEIREEASK
ncbi:MAG: carboxymuconolactone decarboxylase family protein [Alphaproteobacteria bacterium]|nr:carboxymuconolactone decarboxylase family protein [Alphaproteobacteria bacterium]